MRRSPACLAFLSLLAATASGTAALSGESESAASPLVPQYFGTAGGWSYRGDGTNASASTLLLSSDASGVMLLFCEEGAIGFHISFAAADRRSLTGAEDGILQVYAPDASEAAAFSGPGEQLGVGSDSSNTPDQHDDRGDAAAVAPSPSFSLLAQFRIRFFSGFEFRSLPLRQPGWDSPDRLIEIIRDRPEGLRLVVARLRQIRFTPKQTVDLYLPSDTDGSGLPITSALALLERDCGNESLGAGVTAGSKPDG